jgi:outer membrane protein assembly factor BamD (BamD/ComL family)
MPRSSTFIAIVAILVSTSRAGLGFDRARKALGSGGGTDAARTLQLHAHRFPSGFLVEEREALTIKTTVEKGQIEEARKLGLKFRERYPKSLFGPAMDDALGTNP